MTKEQTPHDIVSFSYHTHHSQAVECIMNVRLKDSTYPPQRDVADLIADDFAEWLMEENATHRWVAVVQGKVVGHISLVEGHPYLTDHLALHKEKPRGDKGFLEIGKFFTDPSMQGHGIGTALLRHAIDSSIAEGYTPALAVISTSSKAIEVYKKEGMKSVGYFNGIHGKNFVFVA